MIQKNDSNDDWRRKSSLPIKPQLSCSARTLVMQEILNSLGIK